MYTSIKVGGKNQTQDAERKGTKHLCYSLAWVSSQVEAFKETNPNNNDITSVHILWLVCLHIH